MCYAAVWRFLSAGLQTFNIFFPVLKLAETVEDLISKKS
jgi:hypothetical protein